MGVVFNFRLFIVCVAFCLLVVVFFVCFCFGGVCGVYFSLFKLKAKPSFCMDLQDPQQRL